MDIAIVWDNILGRGDWDLTSGDISLWSDIEGAVMVSLFTDRRAPDDWVPTDGTNDRRGWWADIYEGDQIGSLLWTLDRVKISDSAGMLALARQYCLDALKWLLSTGTVSKIDVATRWLNPGGQRNGIGIQVVVRQPSGEQVKFLYDLAWQGTVSVQPQT